MSDNKKKILFGITGSISAYKACDVISILKKEGFQIIPALSKDAHHFVTPLTIQSIAENKVYQDFFEGADQIKPIHIELADQADLVVVCPASADFIAKMRCGMADDILSCALLAAKSPILVVPAMNDRMYHHEATQENISVLKKRGVHFEGPIKGKLVCSDEAIGHIADVSDITKHIISLLS